jgi:uncharacterized integral membrane protein (TIGR00698 family)
MVQNRGTSFPQAADLYGDLVENAPTTGWRTLLPGLIVTALATLAAGYLSDHYGAPLTLMALLVGLALNFLGGDARLGPGLAFASRTLLRVGIVLVGLRVTVGEMADIGPAAFVALAGIVGITVAVGALLGRAMGFGAAFGTLAGGSVAICGASAALAFATLLGEKRIDRAQLALVLVGVASASAFAMFAYPILTHLFDFSDQQAGFMLGASIHDVAQALGAGYAVGPEAGGTAAIVKLTRVALLAPALAVVALYLPRGEKGSGGSSVLPWFVIGFFIVAAINSLLPVPREVTAWGGQAATWLLAAAVAATGIRSPMQDLLRQGARPLLVIAACSVLLLVLAGAAALLLVD